MSFSSEVKEELSAQISTARHCQIAELTAIICMCGMVHRQTSQHRIIIETENIAVARKAILLLHKTFHIHSENKVRINLQKRQSYYIAVTKDTEAIRVLEATKLLQSDCLNTIVIQQACCKRSFLRGAFLASGSINNPEKAYHFEIVCLLESMAQIIKNGINSFDLDAKIVQRKKYYVVYLKEGAMIVDILNIMEAHISLMNMENVRILKDVRNRTNRRVNCDVANINKTVTAAHKQLDDIRYIEQKIGFGGLSEALREVAEIRIEQPEISLKELGEMLDPPVSKSGVNHRLRKLSALANDLRETVSVQ